MRLRIILLVVAASSLVLVSFLVPLVLVLRTLAADRTVSSATAHAQSMAPLGARTWLLLGCVGLGLLALSVAVADRLARSLVRPLADVARASDRLATGDLSARAELAGPPEVRRAGAGLNRLARRIGELLAYERETIADCVPPAAHPDDRPADRRGVAARPRRAAQLLSDLDALERTVDEVIRAARRPPRTAW